MPAADQRRPAIAGEHRRRHWDLIGLVAVAALFQAGTWLGLAQGAFVFWDSIHAFYFQQSYSAGMLPLGMTGLLLAAAACLLLRRPAWAAVPAFAAMILSLVMLPRLGNASLLHPLIHPMQLVGWAAIVCTWLGCLMILVRAGRRDFR